MPNSSLAAFLAENAIKVENIKFIASKRFIDSKGNPIEWEISCISSAEDERIRKDCTKRVPLSNKRGAFNLETDYNLYLGKLAARCTVYPDLNDVTLQNSYGVMGADTLLKKMLTAGEYAEYLIKIQEINGFDVTLDEKVAEAKN
ncbi:MAG: phage portal protein [Oscillospiraceae bacterium]|nr:phage portal protein [Oscillospiraceae bacterium]